MTFEYLEREDRENDIDDVDWGEFLARKNYIERQMQEDAEKQGGEAVSGGIEEPKPESPSAKETLSEPRKRKDSLRTVHLGVTVSEQTAKKLRILAAYDSTTLSTYIHNLLIKHITKYSGKMQTYND